MTIEETQQAIIEEFSVYTDWMDKYGYLIELGNDLKGLDPKEKTDQYIIKGCQSRVWLVAEMNDGKINFRGESDAVIVKGLVALLLRVVSGRTPKELIENDLHFIDDLHIVKDNLFEIPPLFKLIKDQSETDWKEMYQVFNMGHRMELYVDEMLADEIISISKSFNVDAQIVGKVVAKGEKKLTIKSPYGEFVYS